MCEFDVCCFFHGGVLIILIYYVISWRWGFFILFLCVWFFLYLVLWCSIKIFSKIAPPQLFLASNHLLKLTNKKLNNCKQRITEYQESFQLLAGLFNSVDNWVTSIASGLNQGLGLLKGKLWGFFFIQSIPITQRKSFRSIFPIVSYSIQSFRKKVHLGSSGSQSTRISWKNFQNIFFNIRKRNILSTFLSKDFKKLERGNFFSCKI